MCKQSLLLNKVLALSLLVFANALHAAPLKDPTRPPNAKSAYQTSQPLAIKHWRLSSTLIANGRRTAIINGQLVSLGQTLQQAKIISILPNEVWLLHKKKKIRIKLLAFEIKDF